MGFKFTVNVDLKNINNRVMNDFGVGGDVQRRWSEIVFFGAEPYMPMVTGTTRNLAIAASMPLFSQGELEYPGPYAHYLYEGIKYVDPVTKKAGFLTKDGWKSRKGIAKIPSGEPLSYDKSANPLAGSKWVERAKNDHYAEWTEELQKYIEGR